MGAFWEEFFRSSRQPRFEPEEVFAVEDRCVLRWIYHWRDADGSPGHVRGVDIYRVREGKIHWKPGFIFKSQLPKYSPPLERSPSDSAD